MTFLQISNHPLQSLVFLLDLSHLNFLFCYQILSLLKIPNLWYSDKLSLILIWKRPSIMLIVWKYVNSIFQHQSNSNILQIFGCKHVVYVNCGVSATAGISVNICSIASCSIYCRSSGARRVLIVRQWYSHLTFASNTT